VNFRLPGVVKIFLLTSKQQEEYDMSRLLHVSQRVRGFYEEDDRVFKGSKAAFDKENVDALAANPVVEDLDD
jgi:hypothetical protein